MARLYKRGATWWCYLRGGARVSTRCTDRRAAEIAAARLERDAADEGHATRARATLADGALALQEELRARGRSAATLARCEQKLGHASRLWGSDLLLRHITPTLVAKYIAKRKEEGMSGTTIRDELAFLRQLLKVAKRGPDPLWSGDVADIMPLQFESGHRPVQRWLTMEQATRLLAHLEPRRAAHVALILATGARLGESVRFERADVQGDVVQIRGTKTHAALAAIPIVPLAAPWLAFALTHMPGERMDPWGKLHRDVKAASKRAGLPVTGPNDWRRSLGHWLAGAGVPAELIGRVLRHETDVLAQTTYARMEGAELGRAIAASVPALYETSAVEQEQLDGIAFENPHLEGAKRRKWRQMKAPPVRIERTTFALGKRGSVQEKDRAGAVLVALAQGLVSGLCGWDAADAWALREMLEGDES